MKTPSSILAEGSKGGKRKFVSFGIRIVQIPLVVRIVSKSLDVENISAVNSKTSGVEIGD